MADALAIRFGDPFPYWAGGLGFNSFTLNQATDQWEIIFQAEEAAIITKLGFRYGTRTGTPPQYKISLQGVADGIPDGTIKGGGSPASKTFTPPADATWNSTWRRLTLDNAYTCTRGELLAAVIAHDSGTVDASNCSSFTNWMTTANQNFRRPYSIQNDNGSRSRQPNLPVFGYESASKVYGRPIVAVNTHTFQSGTNPNEYAIKFTVPAGWTDTFTLGRFGLLAALTAAGSQTVTLYDGGLVTDVTPLQQIALDSDYWQVGAGQGPSLGAFDEVTLSTLTAGSTYRLSFLAGSATNFSLYTIDVDAVSDWDAWPGGQNVLLSTRNGGNWTDLSTRRLYGSDVILDAISEAAAGSGGGVLIGGKLVL